MTFHPEFPDYPTADLPALPEGFVDSSWHNDVAPSYLHGASGLQVFMDYRDEAKRECAGTPRFSVIRIDQNDTSFTSDNWADVLNFLQAEKTRVNEGLKPAWSGS
jgi:hypothetical protein